MLNVIQGLTTSQVNGIIRKEKNIEDANDDELVHISSGVVSKVNRIGKYFYNTMRDIVEKTYRGTFHLQY